MIKRVMVMDTERWRLVMDKLTILLTKGCWSMKISSRVDMQDRPKKLTENMFGYKDTHGIFYDSYLAIPPSCKSMWLSCCCIAHC